MNFYSSNLCKTKFSSDKIHQNMQYTKHRLVGHLIFLMIFVLAIQPSIASWDDWWTYDGISGTDFWGLLNPEWILCTKGRRQSPVNIDPDNLLFDPELKPLHIDQTKISGILENNGHSIVYRMVSDVDHSLFSPSTASATSSPSGGFEFKDNRKLDGSPQRDDDDPHTGGGGKSSINNNNNGGSGYHHHHLPSSSHHHHHAHHPSSNSEAMVTMSGGPLSYRYNFDSIYLHFGRTDVFGSEHVVAGVSFPAELQMYGYNSDLYQNMSDALNKANGLAAISLLIQIGNVSNPELKSLLNPVNHIRFRGQNVTIKSISIHDLIPDHEFYMTYEGSITIPGCQETVTWIVINKPIFITRQQLFSLRKMMQGDLDSPKAPLGNNFRPSQELNRRVIRTNIDFRRNKGSNCPSMKTRLHYQVNSKHLVRP